MSNNQGPEIRLSVMGDAKPVFANEAEERAWRENFMEKVQPELKRQALARALSEHSARQHMVD